MKNGLLQFASGNTICIATSCVNDAIPLLLYKFYWASELCKDKAMFKFIYSLLILTCDYAQWNAF